MTMEVEAAARIELQEIALELTRIRYRLLGIVASLPRPRKEDVLRDEEEPDRAAAIRSILECVVADQINPAIHDLGRAVAAVELEQPA